MIVFEQNLNCHQKVLKCLVDADHPLHHFGYTGTKYSCCILFDWVFEKRWNIYITVVQTGGFFEHACIVILSRVVLHIQVHI